MTISNIIKKVLENDKSQIELLQISMISSIAGLLYSEYILNFKQVTHPIKKVFIPEIKQVEDILNVESDFMKHISIYMIDEIYHNNLFQEFIHLDEFKLFRGNNIEVLKSIVDLYILPNVSNTIPRIIRNKFGLNNPSNQMLIESNEIDIFDRKSLSKSYLKYIMDQTVLQLIMNIPTLNRIKTNVEVKENFNMIANNKIVLTIDHENAIAPINFNKQVIDNQDIMKLLSFVTMTSIESTNDTYIISSNANNRITITEIGCK